VHREPVFRFLWRLAGNPHDAEDLLQDTFVTFWRKRDQFRGDGRLLGYLRRIAWRTYLNSRSRISARRPPRPLDEAAESANGEDPLTETEERDARAFFRAAVERELRRLPDGPREAFLLFRFEGMTVREVAETTESPPKTVESRIRRATELLAARLKRHRDQVI